MNNNIINSFIIINFIFVVHTLAQYHSDKCIRDIDNSPGSCIPQSKCPRVIEESRVNGIHPQRCSNIDDEPVVCCPDDRRSAVPLRTLFLDKPISERKCEEYSKLSFKKVSFVPLLPSPTLYNISVPQCDYSTPLIVGGEEAKVGEFPHMAAIGWTNAGTGDLEWNCGGSVISEKFILTAAHCLSSNVIPPDTVRVGDHNLKSDGDRTAPEDYRILQSFKHPDYVKSRKYNDIALLEVDSFITFTKNIRPACLWQTETLNFTKTIATGWGRVDHAGSQSDVLLKVVLDIVSTEKCRELYLKPHAIPDGIIDTQLCAGASGKDTCQGDSGGPIQVTTLGQECIFHIVGITSFGTFCGTSAGVYTRVSSYIGWIESIVWRE